MTTCILTFDDGFRSHFDFVRPLLMHYGLKGTFFINGSFICRDSASRQPVKIGGYQSSSITEYLIWDEVKKMSADGFEIGNHLWKHLDMRKCQEERLFAHAKMLDDKLVSIGVPKTQTIAYPSFFTDDNVFRFARKYGFRFGRSGCGRTKKFEDYQFGGFGSGFVYKKDDHFDVNCTFVFGQKYRANDFIRDIEKISNEEVSILCFHDFGNGLSADIPADDFIKVLNYIRVNKIRTVNFCNIQ